MEFKYPTLSNAPITEALIDLQVKLPDGGDPALFDLFLEETKSDYPNQKAQKRTQYKVQPTSTSGPLEPKGTQVYGYQCFSSDGVQVVQARIDGFTFSRLKPYTTWDDIKSEAYRLWTLYTKIFQPEFVSRVAVRYINNLQIPMPISDFSDYLTAPPIVPKSLPQTLSSFLTRNVILMPTQNTQVIITQALENIISDSKPAPVILDIDAFKLTPEGINDVIAWEVLEQLRLVKNNVFFDSITENLRGLYE